MSLECTLLLCRGIMRILKWIIGDVAESESRGLDEKLSSPRVRYGGISPLALQRWLPGLLETEIAAPSSSPQPHDPPAALLPVSLNIMLNWRSNGRKQTNKKKNQPICIAWTCYPFFSIFLTCTPALSFLSLYLIVLLCLGGVVVFEMLSSHGMGQSGANCKTTKSRHRPRLHSATHFRHEKQSLQWDQMG